MALPTHTFSKQQVKFRYGERYVSQAANQKFTGFPFGVHLGFTPVATTGSLLLQLETDTAYGISLARTQSTVDQLSLDISIAAPIELDFDGHDFVADPTVYVMVRASAGLGSATTAEVFTRDTGPGDLTEQLLCVVTKPSDDLVVTDDPPTNRSTPYAYAGAPTGFGFMASGAIEEIQQSVAMVAEVIAARTDLDSVTHAWNPPADNGLHDRIIADLQPAAVASRLGLIYRVVRSNNHTLTTDTSEINVSASLTETARVSLPVVTFDGDGSETQVGAVTAEDAEGRNVCFVVEDGKNVRPVDDELQVAFGRLELDEKNLDGTLTFSAVSTTVTGSGTDFDDPTQVTVGDTILAPDGKYYTIASITPGGVILDLDQIPSAGGASATPPRRRWLLKMFTRSSSGEAALTITSGTTLRFFFGAWFSIGSSVYDATLEMFEGGEAPPLPLAAVGVEGKVQMYPGLVDAKAGAVQDVQLRGGVVGTGAPVYSLGFDGAADATGGVASITMKGAKGIQGIPGTGKGPDGNQGSVGDGFDSFSAATGAFAFLPNPSTFGPAPGGTVHRHTYVFPSAIKYLYGGIQEWDATPGMPFWDQDDHFDITSALGGVFRLSATEGVIELTRPTNSPFNPATNLRVFLNGAG